MTWYPIEPRMRKYVHMLTAEKFSETRLFMHFSNQVFQSQ